jgi:alpha-L-fucosidase 2
MSGSFSHSRSALAAVALTLVGGAGVAAAKPPAAHDAARYNVTFDSLGRSFRDSMPVGNGDLGLNVWTEPNGDLVFLVGKTDAYTENGQLVKLGRVRVALTPNPFTRAVKFTQTLNAADGEIDLRAESVSGAVSTFRVWVDANRPLVHVEGTSAEPVEARASVELWRTAAREIRQGGEELGGTGVLRELNNSPVPAIVDPDIILPARGNRLSWCHFNARSTYLSVMENQHLQSLLPKYPDPLLHRTFGMSMFGPGLIADGDQALKSAAPARSFRLDRCALTEKADSPAQWREDLDRQTAGAEATRLEVARAAHRRWWRAFWDRSYVDVTGSADADKVTMGYAMQRYMNACGGRGAIPIKYNGSIFTVGAETPAGQSNPAKGERNADFRAWGGNFWAQNERQIYWPMIASGDYDLLAPYLAMYHDDLPLEIDRTRLYYGHDGASYPETMYFFGTPNNNDFHWNNQTNVMQNTWIRNHVVGGVETVAMMLSRYENTRDAAFARDTLLPVADAVAAFYANHWPRDAHGKVHMDPAQAVETYQQAVNPTPDIAGLRDILPSLIALPKPLTSANQRARWSKLLADLPPIPLGMTGPDGKMPKSGEINPAGKPTILPAEVYSRANNVENPELYAIFPFRRYGVGFPDLERARTAYAARAFKSSTCWGQDGEDAALLGLPEVARSEAIANFTAYGGERFPYFWKQGHDYEPDMDNGGAGQSILQLMLMQCDGRRIQLLPAWPADWNADFKLYAPDATTVSGTVVAGKLTRLDVSPRARQADVVVCPAADAGETKEAIRK